MTSIRRSWPWWRWVLTGLIALALTLSGYLGWHYLVGGSVIGCGVGSPCDEVLNSRWSSIGGVLPVSGLAAGAYLAMLTASFFIGPATEASVRRLAWGALLILVGSAAGSAVWFIMVQKWAIGAFCPYCMATHITGLLLATLILWQAPRQSGIRRIGPWPAFGLASIGLALAGILAACQVAFPPPPVYRGGEAQISLPALDLHAVPLIGSPDAPYVIDLLFDYKCPHCQQLHFMLDEVVRRYGGKLAIALCPSPLSTNCNPYVPRQVDEFKGSCELARIGLAVWLAKHEALPAFDLWMFSHETGDRWQPRSLDAAQAKAIELVGQANFEAARTNHWVDQYLQQSIRIYGATTQNNNAVPKLVYGSHWVIPQPNDADDLIQILQNSLSVPKP